MPAPDDDGKLDNSNDLRAAGLAQWSTLARAPLFKALTLGILIGARLGLSDKRSHLSTYLTSRMYHHNITVRGRYGSLRYQSSKISDANMKVIQVNLSSMVFNIMTKRIHYSGLLDILSQLSTVSRILFRDGLSSYRDYLESSRCRLLSGSRPNPRLWSQ